MRHIPSRADLMNKRMAEAKAHILGAQKTPNQFSRCMHTLEPSLKSLRVHRCGQVLALIHNGAQAQCFQERMAIRPPAAFDRMIERLHSGGQPKLGWCRAGKFRVIEDDFRLHDRVHMDMFNPRLFVGNSRRMGELSSGESRWNSDLRNRGTTRIPQFLDHQFGNINRTAPAEHHQYIRIYRTVISFVDRTFGDMLDAIAKGSHVPRSQRFLDPRDQINFRRHGSSGDQQRPRDAQSFKCFRQLAERADAADHPIGPGNGEVAAHPIALAAEAGPLC